MLFTQILFVNLFVEGCFNVKTCLDIDMEQICSDSSAMFIIEDVESCPAQARSLIQDKQASNPLLNQRSNKFQLTVADPTQLLSSLNLAIKFKNSEPQNSVSIDLINNINRGESAIFCY